MVFENLIVYEDDWILSRVYQVSDRIRHHITDQTLFEERCINRLSNYLNIDSKRKRNRRYIERMINEVAKSVINRNRNELSDVFSSLVTKNKDGDEIEFEPIDVLANVESEIMAEEMTALLGKDGRRKVILNEWSLGNTNSKSISRTLARTLGGNEETHRKFVHRFEKECQERLEAVS